MKRQYCRECGSLAGFTRNICTGCQAAEVERHLRESASTTMATKGQPLQEAYGKALQVKPVVK